MASAKKCDRCGNYYDENTKYFVEEVGICKIHISGISTLQSLGIMHPMNTDTKYDLCDECLESFYNWLVCE